MNKVKAKSAEELMEILKRFMADNNDDDENDRPENYVAQEGYIEYYEDDGFYEWNTKNCPFLQAKREEVTKTYASYLIFNGLTLDEDGNEVPVESEEEESFSPLPAH